MCSSAQSCRRRNASNSSLSRSTRSSPSSRGESTKERTSARRTRGTVTHTSRSTRIYNSGSDASSGAPGACGDEIFSNSENAICRRSCPIPTCSMCCAHIAADPVFAISPNTVTLMELSPLALNGPELLALVSPGGYWYVCKSDKPCRPV